MTNRNSLREVTITKAQMLSDNVRELTIDPGKDFEFVPGQWVSFRLPTANNEVISRAYSIASAPRTDGQFDLAITRVEHGPGSEYLHKVSVGTVLTMTEAQGFFTLETIERPVIFVATGTGVTPLRSMIVANLDKLNTRPFALLFGVRTEQDILFRSEFEQLTKSYTNFQFIPTLSRSDEHWTGRKGYVQHHLPDIVQSINCPNNGADVYICGLNRMIKEVRKILKDSLGYTRERIHTERYD